MNKINPNFLLLLCQSPRVLWKWDYRNEYEHTLLNIFCYCTTVISRKPLYLCRNAPFFSTLTTLTLQPLQKVNKRITHTFYPSIHLLILIKAIGSSLNIHSTYTTFIYLLFLKCVSLIPLHLSSIDVHQIPIQTHIWHCVQNHITLKTSYLHSKYKQQNFFIVNVTKSVQNCIVYKNIFFKIYGPGQSGFKNAVS